MVSASGRCLNVASPLPLMGLMLRFTCPKTQGAPIVIVRRRRRRRQSCCFGSVGMGRKTFVLNKPWYVNMWSVGGRVVDSPPASTALTVDGGWIEYCSEFGYSTGDDAISIPDHVYGTAAVWIVWTDYCFFFATHPSSLAATNQPSIPPSTHPTASPNHEACSDQTFGHIVRMVHIDGQTDIQTNG